MTKFDDTTAFDWDDLRQLVRRTQAIDPAEIAIACQKGFAFLTELDPHQRNHALWGMLRDRLPVSRH